jgi:hypothetical protein
MVGVALCLLAGCAKPLLPYTPVEQPPGARISAAYQIVGDRLRIEIDTDGRRLEAAQILRPDGTGLAPQKIERQPVVSGGYPIGVGIGVGGGHWGGDSGVGVGTGVSADVPVGGGRVEGNTLAFFPLDQAGPAPWRLRVTVAGVEPVIIVVGGPGGGPR